MIPIALANAIVLMFNVTMVNYKKLSSISQNKKLKIVRVDQIALMVVTNATVRSVNVKIRIRMLTGMNA